MLKQAWQEQGDQRKEKDLANKKHLKLLSWDCLQLIIIVIRLFHSPLIIYRWQGELLVANLLDSLVRQEINAVLLQLDQNVRSHRESLIDLADHSRENHLVQVRHGDYKS